MSIALLIMDCKKSEARTKSKSDSGSPCLTLLLQLKVFHGISFNKTAEVAEESIASIHDNHFKPKPLALRILNKA
jgi:hypothetical protein